MARKSPSRLDKRREVEAAEALEAANGSATKKKATKKKATKKKAAKKKVIEVPKPKPILKIGDRVRMEDGKAIGSIDKLEKNKAIVNYGIFTTNINVDLLELVESGK